MPPRVRFELASGDAAILLGVLVAARADETGLPPDSERRERLEKVIRRLEEQVAERRLSELRASANDWDVIDHAIGLGLKDLRAAAKAAFDTIAAALARGGGGSDAVAAARRDLVRLERLEAIEARLTEQAEFELGARARRRWLLR